MTQTSIAERFATALAAQRDYLKAYEKPSEPVVYETLRTLDDLFCRDLMEPDRRVAKDERLFRSLSTWGIDYALRRIVPRAPSVGPFRNFPSREPVQGQADDFVFNCGVLCLAERFEGWLREGILSAELRPYPNGRQDRLKDILILRNSALSCSDEEIGMAGLRWASDLRVSEDRHKEQALEERHPDLEPELQKRVQLLDGWLISYSTTREIDDYFLEWGRLYLRRIFSQDMIGPDDVIGGRAFSRYVEVLAALSGRAQKHIAYAAILRARHHAVHIRNLLTTYAFANSCSKRMPRLSRSRRRRLRRRIDPGRRHRGGVRDRVDSFSQLRTLQWLRAGFGGEPLSRRPMNVVKTTGWTECPPANRVPRTKGQTIGRPAKDWPNILRFCENGI